MKVLVLKSFTHFRKSVTLFMHKFMFYDSSLVVLPKLIPETKNNSPMIPKTINLISRFAPVEVLNPTLHIGDRQRPEALTGSEDSYKVHIDYR